MKAKRRIRGYIAILSLTSALDGDGWSTPRPGRFTPREREPVPIVQEAWWAPGPVRTGVENLSPPPGFDHRTVQPVVIRYPGPRPLVVTNPTLFSHEFSPRIKYWTRPLIYVRVWRRGVLGFGSAPVCGWLLAIILTDLLLVLEETAGIEP